MNRVQFLMQGMEINEVQASIVSELIIDIPNNQLKNFLIFRMSYVEPMMSKELITKKAITEYRKEQTLARIRAGEKPFETVEQLKRFMEENYKNKDIGNGLGAFKEFVVIRMNKDGELVNTYYVPNGYHTKIDGEQVARIYKYLLENQDKIGKVEYYTQHQIEEKKRASEIEYKQQEQKKQEEQDDTISPKVLEMLSKTKKI